MIGNAAMNPSRPVQLVRLAWTGFGLVALGMGAVGAVLPLLPTTPFVILAAFCLAHGSPPLARLLERHRVFGPIIADWRAHRAIARRHKLIAHLMMAAALVASATAGVLGTTLTLQATCLLFASAYVLSRPGTGKDPQEPDEDCVPARPTRRHGATHSGEIQ
ncbi:MAG: YbaN family protein [Pseudomonadota bacterium]